MSDTVTLDFIGARLQAIQFEQRGLRLENELIRRELGRLASAMISRELLNEVVQVLSSRINTFEVLMETRMQALEERVEQRLGGIEQRLDGVEQRIGGIEGRLDGLALRMAGLEAGMDTLNRSNHTLAGLLTAVLDRLPPPA